MKSFVKHSIAFLGFSSLIYLILIFIWGSVMPIWLNSNLIYKQRGGHLHARLTELNKYQNVDVLFLGSSHAYRGFDTRIFKESGIHSFNLGSSSQAPVQSLLLLKKHIEKLQPKKIIFEVCPQSLSSDGIESALDIISNDKIDFQTIKMAIDLNHIKVYNTLIYSGIRQLLNLDQDFVEAQHIGKDTYISGGYVQRDDVQFEHKSPLEKNITPEQLKAFKEVVSWVKSKDIELILVQAPVTTAEYHSYADNAGFDKLMQDYSSYYNFNTLIMLDDSLHFYDPHHLNQLGVETFNAELIDLLID
ncbi:MAG: hypothetical protein ISP71_08520 [Flavobacteriales bacterium]|nr:hypothetical protein [Flavobacteriales bacterium]